MSNSGGAEKKAGQKARFLDKEAAFLYASGDPEEGRLAQRKSVGLTRRGPQVRSLHRPCRNPMTTNISDRLLVVASIAMSLGGVAGFLYLFIPNFNIYWLILSPIILAVYELPAVYLLWLYKRRKAGRTAAGRSSDAAGGGPGGIEE